MKVYNLSCPQEHCFEGWFGSEDDFVVQVEKSQIACPVCGDHHIKRMPSAPRLNLAVQPDTVGEANNQVMREVQRAWLEAARRILASTEDVGERFADEARRIHYREAEERAIRGTPTVSQVKELVEEGIEVMMMPLPGGLKQPLH